mmetsp:Transcript_51547/g.124442  ORF Transcript_51547/g.124442 Transcript_51547/m.124442 type:complete len:488 (+) Transcript_51547:160-1623(+)
MIMTISILSIDHLRCHGRHGRRRCHGNTYTKGLHSSNAPKRSQRSFGIPTYNRFSFNRVRRRSQRTVSLAIAIVIAIYQSITAFGNNNDRHTISATNAADFATLPIFPVASAFVLLHTNRLWHQRCTCRTWGINTGNSKYLGTRQSSLLLARYKAESDQDDSDGDNNNSATNSTVTVNETIEQGKKYWVVLIDDEEDLRLAVSDFLYDKGYHVSAYADAPTFLEFCNDKDQRQQQQRTPKLMGKVQSDASDDDNEENDDDDDENAARFPDAVISDVRMPGGPNGVELVKAIRSHPSLELRTIPIVMLTAKALAQDRIEGYQAGADFYLPKPFSPDELVSIIDNMISRKEQRRKAAEEAAAAATSTAIALKKNDNEGTSSDGEDDNRKSIVPTDIPDLLQLKQELEEIKSIMKENAERVVQKTDVCLQDRERVVLELVCDGYTNGEIAEQCGVSAVTINRCVKKLKDMTETKTRTELARWAVSTGYVS